MVPAEIAVEEFTELTHAGGAASTLFAMTSNSASRPLRIKTIFDPSGLRAGWKSAPPPFVVDVS